MEEKGMSENKQYENEYKVQVVKLAKKIGAVNAANELQIPVNTRGGEESDVVFTPIFHFDAFSFILPTTIP